jgi:aconitase B
MKQEINRHEILDKITPVIENTAVRYNLIPIEIEFVKENHRWFLRIYLYSYDHDITLEDCEKVKESFSLVHKQLTDALAKIGMETIECVGQEFDPNFHEAVMQTPTSEYPEHTIIAELQKGYKLGDRVLRPALVNVATAE